MPLPKGLTPRIAEIGKIKIGYLGEERKKKSSDGTYRLPVKLDRFLVTGSARGKDGRLIIDETLMQDLCHDYGDADGKLRQIPIYVLSDDPDEILQARYVKYQGRVCLATCDGETLTTHREGVVEISECKGEHEGKGWKAHANFSCVIAHKRARFGGVYKFRTTSVISIQQLYGGLLHILSLTGGILVGIPLRLIVRPMQVSPEGKPTTVYVVHVELHAADLGEIQQKALAAATYRAQHYSQIREAQRQYVALLSAPGDEDPDEIEHIVAEYLPAHEETDVAWSAPDPEELAEDEKKMAEE